MKKMKRVNNLLLLAVPFILGFIIYSLSLTPLIKYPQRQVTDYKFREFPVNPIPDEDIMLVVIDDSSLQFFQDNGVSFPWPRIFYGEIVTFLKSVGAKAVFFDVIFNEQDLNRDEIDGRVSDEEFASALSQIEKVYLASQMLDDGRFSFVSPSEGKPVFSGELPYLRSYQGLISPIPVLANVSQTGFVNIFPDSDGVIRAAKLVAQVDGKILPAMVLKLFADINQIDEFNLSKNKLNFNNHIIPVSSSGDYQISWYKNNDFQYVPIKAVIQSASAHKYGYDQTLVDSIFKDKIIFIGATASGLKDIRAVPIDQNIPGVEIWATVLSNFLQNDFQKQLPKIWQFLFIVILSYILVGLSKLSKQLYSYLGAVLVLVFVSIIDFLVWKYYRLELNLIAMLTSAITTFIIMQIIQYVAEVRHRQKLKKTFGRYLNDNLVEYLARDDSELVMGGRESQVSVLFSDIYDFTTISEKMQPQEIVATLNEYFDDLTKFVLQHDGLLDKYTGDGIMAVFGSPLPDLQHARKACQVLVDHKRFVENLKTKDELNLAEQIHLNTRLAVNSGLAVTGNIGSTKRMDFTAIGDTVNLAARLEAVNKLYGTNYLISEATYQEVKEYFEVRKLDIVMVKGRETGTTIYELLGEKGCEVNENIVQYEKAWELYATRKWVDAREILRKQKQDPPSEKLVVRIEKLIKEEPVEWDCVLKLYAK